MRIVQLGMGWFDELPGGLDRFYAGLLPRLAQAGDSVDGIVAGSDRVPSLSGGLARAAAPLGAPLPRRLAAFRGCFRDSLEKTPVDLVAAHFALFCRPVLDLVRTPLVFHFHGPWAAEGRSERDGALATFAKKRLVELPVLRRADRLIVLSNAFADILVRDYGIPTGRIHVVPGGFDPTPFQGSPPREEARRSLGWPSDRRILLCVRRLRRRMGIENLIAAVDLLRRDHPDVLLMVAGKGPLAGELESAIRTAGLQDHVRLLGFVPDQNLPACYAAADLSVVPTVALEGFGLIVAESLAAGTPVVATPVGALPEILGAAFPQLLCAGTGAESLRDTIGSLFTDPSSVPDRDACRTHAATYGWDRVVPAIRSVYADALRSPGR